MHKLKFCLTLFSILICYTQVTVAQSEECKEYHVAPTNDNQNARITTICRSGDQVEITHKEIEGTKRNSDTQGEADSTENSATSNSAEAGPASIEKYRNGTATERLKFVGHSIYRWAQPWVTEHWQKLLALLIGLTLLWLVFKAWRNAKEELNETKKANAIQLQPYFEYQESTLTWHNGVKYYEPAVAFTLKVKNTGQSGALKVSTLKVDSCEISYGTDDPAKIDDEKYSKHIDTVVKESEGAYERITESDIRNFFPKNDISREQLNPQDFIEYFVVIPLKNVPDTVNTKTLHVTSLGWTVKGHFLFENSVGKDKRRYNFHVVNGTATNQISGDGTIVRTGGSTNDTGRPNSLTTSGRLDEHKVTSAIPKW